MHFSERYENLEVEDVVDVLISGMKGDQKRNLCSLIKEYGGISRHFTIDNGSFRTFHNSFYCLPQHRKEAKEILKRMHYRITSQQDKTPFEIDLKFKPTEFNQINLTEFKAERSILLSDLSIDELREILCCLKDKDYIYKKKNKLLFPDQKEFVVPKLTQKIPKENDKVIFLDLVDKI